MSISIQTVHEGKRGCGYRKAGGIYLRSDGAGMDCGKMPIPLDVCPCCHAGVKQGRGWTWINGKLIVGDRECSKRGKCHAVCPLNDVNLASQERVGLLWIGAAYYKTPEEFSNEAARMGLSRRIAAVPKGFKLGESWVWLAHPAVIGADCPECSDREEGDPRRGTCKKCNNTGRIKKPGVFRVFRPERIEYVVKDTDTEEKLAKLVARGITPIRVELIGTESLSLQEVGAS